MRDFDGANDNIAFGSDASIDQFVTKTISGYFQKDNTSVAWFGVGKDRFAAAWGIGNSGGGSDNIEFYHAWSGTDGAWLFTNNNFGTGLRHVVVTYDGGATTNAPRCWFNGVEQTSVNQVLVPTGSLDTDAAANLRVGETGANGADMDGRIGWLCYDSVIWDAAAINRARYWGRPHGGIKVYHPFTGPKLGNEGTATATGTASGTTIVAGPCPVVRPGTACMGLGVGW